MAQSQDDNFESQLAECISALQEKQYVDRTRIEKRTVYKDRTKIVKEIVHEPAEGMPYIKEY
ncbi:hypothetical protein J4228_03635 [Candidatus Woesearchaeota archaeon]|nr:hypothetical protein [Candidatus Woesearchaeota archaeon]